MDQIDLSMYEREVGNTSRRLGRSWSKLAFANSPEEAIYRKWGGRDNFLGALALYMIVEKGIDINSDEEAITEAIDELATRSF